ncbi:hypothetical protein ACHHYP_05462 [Achlya hypogyna]|uniref:Alpha-tubulin N-acetyltransferase n=1 Tax=Achlya hypogyna TaxID=1202772 RepID=A0A1V9YXL6_ACHHY|nr:hypothetical protein ACHHYP_05462 [Achlya hypogyna]
MRCCRFDEAVAARPSAREHLEAQIDHLGKLSAEAQELRRPITSAALLAAPKSRDERHDLYVLTDDNATILGYIKVGRKHLYYTKAEGGFIELDPVCLLDFYVLHQRQGHGIRLFQHMLDAQHSTAQEIAYDRPSLKLYPFLAKHYGLTSYVPQANHFVVFDEFFSS